MDLSLKGNKTKQTHLFISENRELLRSSKWPSTSCFISLWVHFPAQKFFSGLFGHALCQAVSVSLTLYERLQMFLSRMA